MALQKAPERAHHLHVFADAFRFRRCAANRARAAALTATTRPTTSRFRGRRCFLSRPHSEFRAQFRVRKHALLPLAVGKRARVKGRLCPERVRAQKGRPRVDVAFVRSHNSIVPVRFYQRRRGPDLWKQVVIGGEMKSFAQFTAHGPVKEKDSVPTLPATAGRRSTSHFLFVVAGSSAGFGTRRGGACGHGLVANLVLVSNAVRGLEQLAE